MREREIGTRRQTESATRERGKEGESRRAIIASLHGKLLGDVTPLYKKASVVCNALHQRLGDVGRASIYDNLR